MLGLWYLVKSCDLEDFVDLWLVAGHMVHGFCEPIRRTEVTWKRLLMPRQ